MKVKQYYPVTLTIDDEPVKLRIKRMTDDEFAAYSARYARVATPTITQFVSRANNAREQARNEVTGDYVVPFEQLCTERLEQMGDEERDKFLAAAAADEDEARAFLKDSFEQFVTVAGGLTEETLDGVEESVTKGLDFLRLFGARRDVLQEVTEAIRAENTLNARQKKVLRSPSASRDGFRQPAKARAGRRRATTASRAETVGSATSAAATPTTPGVASGSPETSGSSGAPSLN